MPKITEMYAFVTQDGDDPDDEGVMGIKIGGTWMPLVGADMARVESIRPHAEEIAEATGKSFRVLKFKLVGEIT